MKRILLFMMTSVFLVMSAISQDNLISSGDFETDIDWKVSVLGVNKSDLSILFNNPTFPPKYGNGNNLRIGWNKIGYFEMFLYRKVILKVGKTYEFSGAFRDVATDKDATYFWNQILIMPVNGFEDMSNGPDWGTFGSSAPIMLSMGSGWGNDDGGGLGQNTTYTFCSNNYGGSFTGILNDGAGTGDTTIFTVPNLFPSNTGGLDLGSNGTEVEFFFMLYLGQGNFQNNVFDFTFDEFSIHEYMTSGIYNDIEVDSDNLRIYPNPVGESLNVTSACEISSFSIVNIVGQEVLRINNIHHNTDKVNISGLDKGIYSIIVKNANGKISSRKLIKE